MGNPFINAVYIGHPGWKAMGGRIGYSAATGIMVILLCWFGTISLMLALIPSVAILPILLYIGMLIGSQAFQETPRRHAPAIVLSLVPHLANWGLTRSTARWRRRARSSRRSTPRRWRELVGRMTNEGVLYDGLHVLGGGSILGGLILGAIARVHHRPRLHEGAGFALAGAVLTFFGFMHGERIGIGQTPTVAVGYLAIAGILFGLRQVRPASAGRSVDRQDARITSADRSKSQTCAEKRSARQLARGVTESPVDAAAIHAQEPRRLHRRCRPSPAARAGSAPVRRLRGSTAGSAGGAARAAAGRRRGPCNQAQVDRLDRLAAALDERAARSRSSARGRCRETCRLSSSARARGVSGGLRHAHLRGEQREEVIGEQADVLRRDRAAAASRPGIAPGGSRGSCRKAPLAIRSWRSALVAATTRTSTRFGVARAHRHDLPSSSTRSSFAWSAGGMSPISSRNSVPPSASSNHPLRSVWRR